MYAFFEWQEPGKPKPYPFDFYQGSFRARGTKYPYNQFSCIINQSCKYLKFSRRATRDNHYRALLLREIMDINMQGARCAYFGRALVHCDCPWYSRIGCAVERGTYHVN